MYMCVFACIGAYKYIYYIIIYLYRKIRLLRLHYMCIN